MAAAGYSLPTSILDILPNPVLVKNRHLEYVWINRAFEQLFSVKREDVIGKLDKQLFPDRQVAQCNGGDLRVLATGEVDEAVETVFRADGQARETITRKSRLIIDRNDTYLVGVMHDITDVTRANEALEQSQVRLEQQAVELARLATTDALTGCANRRMLDRCGEQLFDNPDCSAALLMLDIDHFKRINDEHGHDCGDAVLKHFAQLIISVIGSDDHFIRLGGEEFAVSQRDCSRLEVEAVADRIRQKVEGSIFLYDGARIVFTVSIGVACKESGTRRRLDDILACADASLYTAKTSGRNRVVLAA